MIELDPSARLATSDPATSDGSRGGAATSSNDTPAPQQAQTDPQSTEQAEWLLLFYLAGDLDNPRGEAIRDDLCEILSAPLNPKVRVVVQFDCHDNCYRYIPSDHPERHGPVEWIIGRSGLGKDGKLPPEWEEREGYYYFANSRTELREPYEILGRINSGSEDELENFLVWGMSMIPAKRVALVLSGKNKLERDRLTTGNTRHPIVFTICRDDSTRKHLGFVDFSRSIKSALEKAERSHLDILALDSTQSQFLELAHELDKAVSVLIGPQTAIPMRGWNYTKVIHAWQEAVMNSPKDGEVVKGQKSATPPDVKHVGGALVEAITESYREAIKEGYTKKKPIAPRYIDSEGEPEVCSVSALDLSSLEGTSINFDTVCLSFMQALGEGQIWDTRGILHDFLRHKGISDHEETSNPKETSNGKPPRKFEDNYDCMTFFGLLELSMRVKSATSTADWLAWMLSNHGSGDWNQLFWNKLRTALKSPPASFEGRDEKGVVASREVDLEWLKSIRDVLGGHERHKNNPIDREAENLVHLWKGHVLQKQLRQFTWGLMEQWYVGNRDDQAARLVSLNAADNWLYEITKGLISHLSDERQQSFTHSDRASRIAARLAEQAHTLVRNLELDGGLVIAKSSTQFEGNDRRWSGISLYRPARLDELMNEEYQKFSFHRKIHWAALLGAIHLIENRGESMKSDTEMASSLESGEGQKWDAHRPPLALWRLISSLLTTGSAGTRRDLLERLSGKNSVIWGMRNQFRVLAPAPMLTLSIKKSERNAEHDEFVASLETTRQDAVITECKGLVRKEILEGLLGGINRLLQGDPKEPESRLKRLKSFGSILGDEVLQHLGRILGVEARSISEEARSQGVEKPVVHLQLDLAPELMRYPWELMSFNNRMLGEELAIGRRVYIDSGHARPIAKRQQGRIRVLIVAPEYHGRNALPYAEKEAGKIVAQFDELCRRLGTVVSYDTLLKEEATWENFRHKVSEQAYDIIHFAGHGVFRGNDPESSSWIFANNQPITARSFRRFMHNHPSPPWLVYANACQSAADTSVTMAQKEAVGAPAYGRASTEDGQASPVTPALPLAAGNGRDAAAMENPEPGAGAENLPAAENGAPPRETISPDAVSGELVAVTRDALVSDGTRDRLQDRMDREFLSPYQGEVFGLASAFIGQGVDAYIGSLWKIGDEDAATIAERFYRELLLNRATLGEALLRAKEAWREEARDSGSLSWTGLVLYGDPTGELVQALAGGEYRDQKAELL